MPISISRKTAFRHLVRISRDGAYSSEVLGYKTDKISSKDLNLIHKLTLGVLRKQILLDFIISKFSSKQKQHMDAEVLIILRLGTYQLLFLDRIPDYSAINESVELTRLARKRSASGFVNAVLRKISDNREKILSRFGAEAEDVLVSHPEWLLDKWRSAYGVRRASSIAMANNNEPVAAFRFTRRFDMLDKGERSSVEKSLAKLDGFKRSRVAPNGFVVNRIGEMLREYARAGIVYFQDEASQLAAEIFTEMAGKRLLDLCAAPGSKATQIARNQDFDLLVAAEYHPHRARLLHSNALLQKTEVSVVCADGLGEMPFETGTFDTVLVDAPCSGTGTLRRNPEIRYRLEPEDLNELKVKQLRLLLTASKHLRPSGCLIYSTCSLESEENEAVIDGFLSEETGFEVQRPEIASDLTDRRGFVRTFPDTQNTDGFFVACLRRT